MNCFSITAPASILSKVNKHFDMSEDKNVESCRCCRNPSPNFIKLIKKAELEGTEEKSYYELLQAVTIGIVTSSDELRMPQIICRKCAKQLRTAYIFLMQIQSTYDYYRNVRLQEVNFDENFEQLRETLIEFPKTKSTTEEDITFEVKEESSKSVEDSNIYHDLSNSHQVLINDDGGVKKELEIESTLNENNQCVQDERYSESDEVYDIESLDNYDVSDTNAPIACRCDVCDKVFKDERLLATHKRFTHMPEDEKIPCPLCGYKASRSSALKVHMGLIHGPDIVEEHFKLNAIHEKNFPCQLSERGYQRREDLRKHMQKKHKPSLVDKTNRKVKPPKAKEKLRFLCSFCGQLYNSKKALDGHQLTHTGDRPHECDICHKAFKRLHDMKDHRVIHSDEKPFQCSQCPKSFKRAGKLKMHMRVHSELRPYRCTECEKTFKYPCVLRTHMYMHTGQTPFSCATCGEAFSLRTSLNNHCLRNGHVK